MSEACVGGVTMDACVGGGGNGCLSRGERVMIDACIGGWGDNGCFCSGRGVTMDASVGGRGGDRCLSVCVCVCVCVWGGGGGGGVKFNAWVRVWYVFPCGLSITEICVWMEGCSNSSLP